MKAEKIEAEIFDMVQRKKEQFKEPVVAFVTWHCQEGYERCIKDMETECDYFGYPVFNPSKPGFKVLGYQQ
jgi:hypothetical protein